jgi:hypothetical protein
MDKTETNKNTMGYFITKLSNNIGFSIEEKNPKGKFNPFAVDNSNIICNLYALMNMYSDNSDVPIPNDAMVLDKKSGVKFSFTKELDTDKLTEIIEDQKIENIELNNEKTITVMKNIDKKI